MTEGSETKNISRVRTFAQDAAQLKGTKSTYTPPAAVEKKAVKSTESSPIEAAVKKIIKESPHVAVPKKELPHVSMNASAHTPTPAPSLAPLLRHTASSHQIDPQLAKEAREIGVHSKQSILTDPESGFDVSGNNSGGTIIRDTKRKRFKLLPAMIQATTEWFLKQRTHYETIRHPHHTTTNAEARKEVIEKAVQKSAQAPKEDFKIVAERLKVVARSPYTSELTFKDKEEIPAPQWSYVEEDQSDANTATTALNAADAPFAPEPVQEKTAEPIPDAARKQEIEDTTVNETTEAKNPAEGELSPTEKVKQVAAEVKEESPQVNPTAVVAPSAIEALPPQQTMPEEVKPEEEPVANPAVEIIPEIAETLATVQKENTPTPAVAPRAQKERHYAAIPQRPRFSPQIILVAVVLAATVFGVSLSYFIFAPKDAGVQPKVAVYSTPDLIQANTEMPFALPAGRIELLQQIQSLITSNANVLHTYPTVVLTDGTVAPAPAEQTLQVLSPRTPGSFNRAVREITFGGVGSEPFILLEITSFDIAFAGMLEWEKTMSADLAPLFGGTVIESFDPSARTDTQVRDAFFKDTIASNKNVRLLFDEQGRDRIVYAFIDQNTIAITTTRDVLSILIPLIK